MTEFLIWNGANANYWPDMDEEPEYMRDNYYLEDIDIAYINMYCVPLTLEMRQAVFLFARHGRALTDESSEHAQIVGSV